MVLLDQSSVVDRIELMQLGATRVLSRDASWSVLARIAAVHQRALTDRTPLGRLEAMKVRPRSLQRVLALAPLLLLIVSLPTQVLVRCRMDGQIRERCCCPADEAQDAPVVQTPDCCDREVAVRDVPTARPAPETSAPVVIATIVRSLDLPAPGPRAARVQRLHAPARGGPPILLLKQTFLI